MNSIRKWLYKPKKTDQSLLAQFFYADEDLNAVTSELDSFDGRKDPDRCTALVNHLRQCQDKVLNICQMLMDEVIPEDRAPRDFRAKFPDDVLQENLAGQLWFGAECLAAGSSILNRELESTTMRPLAKAFTKSLENVRNLLREQCFRNPPEFTEKICESLKILDRLFAEFELSYVSAMVPVKTVHEYEAQQEITVLFSETLQRALNLGLLCLDQVDSCDPAVMFTIPRLAIVAGLLIFPDGPLSLDRGELSEMFRPFRSLLLKIRELLWTLSRSELSALERALCSSEEPDPDSADLNEELKSTQDQSSHHHQYYTQPTQSSQIYGVIEPRRDTTNGQHSIQDYLDQFCKDFPQCKEFISDLCSSTNSDSTIELNNEMSVSQYSMNLSQSSGGGEVPSGTRHQRIVNAVTGVIHSNSTSCYVEDGHTVGSCSSNDSTGSETIRSFCCDEERKFYGGGENEVLSNPTSPAKGEEESGMVKGDVSNALPRTFSRTNSRQQESNDDEILAIGDQVQLESLNSPDEEVLTKSHASSSTSHDSGLSSMAETYKQLSPAATYPSESMPSFEFPTNSTESDLPNEVVSGRHSRCYTAGRSGNVSKTLLVPNGTDTHHHRPNHANSQKMPICSGSCCNKDFRASPGGESVCDTSSFDSECQDDVEIALALQAAEIATRSEARSRFKNSADLIHRLFICISGVADQLQTNYAADLRSTLKCVFAMNATPGDPDCDEGSSSTPDQDSTPEPSLDEELHDSDMSEHHYQVESSQSTEVIPPPSWVPDELAPQCMACLATFTVVRRRHHCRACGRVFCGKCSGNTVPLPRYGYGMKPQRVCNSCFVCRVTPFTLPSSAVSLP